MSEYSDSFNLAIGIEGPQSDSFQWLDNKYFTVKVFDIKTFQFDETIEFENCTPELTENFVKDSIFEKWEFQNRLCFKKGDKEKFNFNRHAIIFQTICNQDSPNINECNPANKFIMKNQIKVSV